MSLVAWVRRWFRDPAFRFGISARHPYVTTVAVLAAPLWLLSLVIGSAYSSEATSFGHTVRRSVGPLAIGLSLGLIAQFIRQRSIRSDR